MSKDRELTDEELTVYLDDEINRAVEHTFNKLSEERAEVLDFYSGALPQPFNDRNSSFVSQDVYEGVQSARSVLAEAFTETRRPVRFEARNAADVQLCETANQYCSHVFYRQNDGQRIIEDALFDALTSRNAVFKIWWQTDEEDHVYDVSGSIGAVMQTLQNRDDLDPEKADLDYDEKTGMVTGEVTITRDTSQVRVAVVPPEEFLINPQARCIEEADFLCHRSMRLISDLVAEGYDEEKLRDAGSGDDRELSYSPENVARTRMTQGVVFTREDEDDQLGREYVEVQECYARIDADGTRTRRWKITKVGNYVMLREPADTVMFVSYCPLPVSHSFFGDNFAQKLIPIQKSQTVLARVVLDASLHATFPRYLVKNGTLADPNELMNAQVGGIVNVGDPMAVMPLPAPQLNPYILQVAEMINDQKQSISGVTDLSQGLDKDAIGKQNSGELISQMSSMSQTKLLQMARRFGETLVDVFQAIYQLVLENDRQEHIIQVAGSAVTVSPAQWLDKRHASASVTLNPDQDSIDAQRLQQTYMAFSQDPTIRSMIDPQRTHTWAAQYLKLTGIQDVDNYLLPTPPPPKPQQPNPAEMAQVQLLQAQAQAASASVELEKAKLQLEAQKLEMQGMKLKLDHEARMQALANEREIGMTKARLAVAKQAHDMQMDNEEMEMEMAKDSNAVDIAVNLKG